MTGEDDIFKSGVSHNYYGGALHAQERPISCPQCKRSGRVAETLNEIYRRIPRTQWEAFVPCHVCNENVLRHEDMATQRRVWYRLQL